MYFFSLDRTKIFFFQIMFPRGSYVCCENCKQYNVARGTCGTCNTLICYDCVVDCMSCPLDACQKCSMKCGFCEEPVCWFCEPRCIQCTKHHCKECIDDTPKGMVCHMCFPDVWAHYNAIMWCLKEVQAHGGGPWTDFAIFM
jgi:hypothetical protein